MRGFARRLLAWFDANARQLPWRGTKDPYRIWVSEVMLQQTRVAAAVPYYERFITRFPDVASLAQADEESLLAAWSGLGYYARARNLLKAARIIHAAGEFPSTYEVLRRLPGIGDYTAAAIASIAFGEPRAAVDGNVRRVLSRLSCGQANPHKLAAKLLDPRRPGDFNQALMELGATVCLPPAPLCDACPVSRHCQARKEGRVAEFPARRPRPARRRKTVTLAIASRRGRILFRQQNGFWSLPRLEETPGLRQGREVGRFRHSIMDCDYEVTVIAGPIRKGAPGCRLLSPGALAGLPLTTMSRKALTLWRKSAPGGLWGEFRLRGAGEPRAQSGGPEGPRPKTAHTSPED